MNILSEAKFRLKKLNFIRMAIQADEYYDVITMHEDLQDKVAIALGEDPKQFNTKRMFGYAPIDKVEKVLSEMGLKPYGTELRYIKAFSEYRTK